MSVVKTLVRIRGIRSKIHRLMDKGDLLSEDEITELGIMSRRLNSIADNMIMREETKER